MATKLRGFKYRIYPNKEQTILLNKTFGCVRFVYNKILGDRIDTYNYFKTNILIYPNWYKEEYPFLKEVDSLALTSAYQNVNTAYKNFFEKKAKYPKFKSKKKSKDSYTTYNQKGSIKLIDNQYIKLPKFKEPIKIKPSRKLPENASIKCYRIENQER